MHKFKNLEILLWMVGVGCEMAVGVPVDGGAAGLPAVESVIPAPPVAPAPTPVAPASAPVAPPTPVAGGGSITEHKNPDGSTLTVTRFNGPVPHNAFPSNPFGGWGSPFGSPFFYPWAPAHNQPYQGAL